MTPDERIKEGDVVDVYWENVECEFDCKVLYLPQDVGDCWHLERPDGTRIAVQMFAKMVRKVTP
jgi:hypothetical protein